MILRRIAEAFRQQDWFTVCVEVLIVVFGVFIGLQVDDWNEDRVDRQDETAFLLTLHEDILHSERLTGRMYEFRINAFSNLEKAVDVLFGRAPSRGLTDDECLALAASHLYYVGRSGLPSLIRLQTAGRTGIIRDDALAQALAALTQRREAMEVAGEIFRSLTVDLPQKHADIFRWVPLEVPVPNDPGDSERGLAASCNIELLVETPAAMNGLASNLEFFDAFLRDGLKPWALRSKKVHERLDELLNIHHEEGPAP